MVRCLGTALACILATACSSAASTAENADPRADSLASATVEAGAPSRAPNDAGSAAADAGPARACATVLLACGAPLGYASSDRKRCTISLSATACAEMGFTSGQRVDPQALVDAPFPVITSPTQLYDFCATKHEARHTCDVSAYVPNCESEIAAYAVSLACLSAFQTANCDGDGAPTWCDHIPSMIDGNRAARELNECLCKVGTSCAECLEACDDDEPGQSATCGEAARDYCAANGK